MKKQVAVLLRSILVFCTLPFASSVASTPFDNLDRLINDLNLKPYYSRRKNTKKSPIKIAIFDYGFSGYQNEIGKSLPEATFFHPGQVASPELTGIEHGFRMGQIVYSLMTSGGWYPELAPELHLFETAGYSNLVAAIDAVINPGKSEFHGLPPEGSDLKPSGDAFDLVLMAYYVETGGNGDGEMGLVNKEVSRITNKGILFVGSSGNAKGRTFRAPIKTNRDGFVALPGPGSSVQFRCLDRPDPSVADEDDDEDIKREEGCSARITLSWNDFKEDVSEGTDKDLKLILSASRDANDENSIIATANKKQVRGRASDVTKESAFPREVLADVRLNPGKVYYLRVEDISGNFDPERDALRLIVAGERLHLEHRTDEETLLPPADHPDVLTVGAADNPQSSDSRKLKKPEVFVNSGLRFEGETDLAGSSNSAAMLVATAGLMKMHKPDLNKSDVVDLYADLVQANQGRAENPNMNGEEQLATECLQANLPPPVTYDALMQFASPHVLTMLNDVFVVALPRPDFDNLIRQNYPGWQPGFILVMTPFGVQLLPDSQPIQPMNYPIVPVNEDVKWCNRSEFSSSFNPRKPFIPRPSFRAPDLDRLQDL